MSAAANALIALIELFLIKVDGQKWLQNNWIRRDLVSPFDRESHKTRQRDDLRMKQREGKRTENAIKSHFVCDVLMRLSSLRKLPFYWIINRAASLSVLLHIQHLRSLQLDTLFFHSNTTQCLHHVLADFPCEEFSDFSFDVSLSAAFQRVFHFQSKLPMLAQRKLAGHIRECRGRCKSVAWL